MDAEVRDRLERLLHAARRIVDTRDEFGRKARRRLVRSTGLSAAGVELALRQSLETNPSEAELEALVASVPSAARSHVLLSANVFVAAHRAIALGLAASREVFVRASTREPEMAEILAEAAPRLFKLVERLEPEAGDQLFAYGHAETLSRLRGELPAGVRFHGHGPGFGLVVLHESALEAARVGAVAEQLAIDLVLFDQRGCLSPRLVLIEGARDAALRLGAALAAELARWEEQVPLGSQTLDEREAVTRYRDTFTYAGDVVAAGRGYIGVAPENSPLALAPTGRNLTLLPLPDAAAAARPLADQVTTFACVGPAATEAALAELLPHARRSTLGQLQRPAFDGPVDLRPARGRAL